MYNTIEEMLSNWNKKNVENDKDLFDKIIKDFYIHKPTLVGTDTETTGLDITKDYPFKIIFGYIYKKDNKLVKNVFTFNPNEYFNKIYKKIVYEKFIKYHFFWNASFDISMLNNIGIDLLDLDNIIEGMCFPKLIFDKFNIRLDYGLKEFSEKFLIKDSSNLKDIVIIELNKLKIQREILINNELNNLYPQRKITFAKLEKYKNNYNAFDFYPRDVYLKYKEILKKYPKIRYSDVNNNIINKYSQIDVILTMENGLKYLPYLIDKNSKFYQPIILKNESNIAKVISNIEQNGACIDYNYLLKSEKIVRQTIYKLNDKLHSLFGSKINCNQQQEIRKWFRNNNFILKTKKGKEKTDKETLIDNIKILENSDIKNKELMINILNHITKLRQLEKWYNTYIIKFLSNCKKINDKYFLYGKFNSFGAKTGRFSSNWQQFPKENMTDCFCKNYCTEHEIYDPRKLFISRFNNGLLAFNDYSQMELRVVAGETIRLGFPDVRLLNSYINYENVNNWIPTDMHSLTAKKVWNIPDNLWDPDNNKEHKNLRTISKTANFCIIYGGTHKRVNDVIYNGNNLDKAQIFYDTFSMLFSGFNNILNYCKNEIYYQRQVINAFGRITRFNLNKVNTEYDLYELTKKASSCLCQGGAADLLKDRLYIIWKYIRDNNLKMKIFNIVHDEIQFDLPKNELIHIKKIKELMEQQNIWKLPLLCEVEISDTNWKDKKHYVF